MCNDRQEKHRRGLLNDLAICKDWLGEGDMERAMELAPDLYWWTDDQLIEIEALRRQAYRALHKQRELRKQREVHSRG